MCSFLTHCNSHQLIHYLDLHYIFSREVTPTVISCVSRAVAAASSQHRTRVVIDNADMPSELYNYTENPVFTRVEPQNIIPA